MKRPGMSLPERWLIQLPFILYLQEKQLTIAFHIHEKASTQPWFCTTEYSVINGQTYISCWLHPACRNLSTVVRTTTMTG